MRKMLTVFLVLLFAALASADSTIYYCDVFPEAPDCVCREVTVFDDFGNPKIWNEIEEVLLGSDWFNMYCTGNESMMVQQRVGFQIIKPACEERQEIRQHQEVFEAYCAKCPEPDLVGEWRVRQCVGTKTLYQRDIVAYYFLPNVEECEQGNWMMLKLEETGPCSDSGTIVIPIGGVLPPLDQPATVFAPTAIVVSVLVLVVLAAAVVFVWRHKKRR